MKDKCNRCGSSPVEAFLGIYPWPMPEEGSASGAMLCGDCLASFADWLTRQASGATVRAGHLLPQGTVN